MSLSRRLLLTTGVAASVAAAAGCANKPSEPASGPSVEPSKTGTSAAGKPIEGTLIGDGSQAPTGKPQPNQLPITKLAPGEKPPQFVVFSWDGCAGDKEYMNDFVKAARKVNGTMTMFLSGLYMLPASKRTEYKPPKRKPGSSDINFMSDPTVRKTIIDIAYAWREGNEIGTHFCGHFGDKQGVMTWTSEDWEQEINESYKFVENWRTYTGWTDIPPLPFDYRKELVGSRTPLLAGRDAMLPVAKKFGWCYDSSGVRGGAPWPKKDQYGIYNMSMFSVPFRGKSILPMDYNFYYSQAKANPKAGTPAERAKWKDEHSASLRAGLKQCMSTNRAPLIIGNHLDPWLGGTYLDSLMGLVAEFGAMPDVKLVSFRWLCDWMDAQDPAVIAALQAK